MQHILQLDTSWLQVQDALFNKVSLKLNQQSSRRQNKTTKSSNRHFMTYDDYLDQKTKNVIRHNEHSQYYLQYGMPVRESKLHYHD